MSSGGTRLCEGMLFRCFVVSSVSIIILEMWCVFVRYIVLPLDLSRIRPFNCLLFAGRLVGGRQERGQLIAYVGKHIFYVQYRRRDKDADYDNLCGAACVFTETV